VFQFSRRDCHLILICVFKVLFAFLGETTDYYQKAEQLNAKAQGRKAAKKRKKTLRPGVFAPSR
jgi:hypothetical protein